MTRSFSQLIMFIAVACVALDGQSSGDRAQRDVAPPVASGSTLSTENVRSAGWYTFGYAARPGAVPNGTGVRCGTLDTQVDVRNRWPDNSLKFAQVTCKPARAGNLTITTGPAARGTFTPMIPPASVSMDISAGEVTGVYVATMPTTVNTADMWCDGPLRRCWRHSVIPVKAGSIEHPTVRVHFDVDAYNDGGARISTWVTNIKDTRAGDGVTAVYTVTIGDVVREGPRGGEKWGSVFIGHFSSWRRSWNVNITEADVAPDFAPFYASKLIHKHQCVAPDARYSYSRDPLYHPGGFGFGDRNVHGSWEAGGAHPYLGYTTAWNLAYLCHKRAGTRAFMIQNAETIGSNHGAFTKGDGVEPINFDTHPNYVDNEHHVNGDGNNGPLHWGSYRASQQNAHNTPALYIPYLVSGDRFFYDALRMRGVYSIMQYTAGGDGTQNRSYGGVNGCCLLKNEANVRAIGRGLQELVHAWMVTRDNEPSRLNKAWYGVRVKKNLEGLDEMSNEATNPANVLGYCCGGLGGTYPGNFQPNDHGTGAQWQWTYVMFAVQTAIDQATYGKDGVNFRDRMLAWILRPIRDNPNDVDFPRHFAMSYTRSGGWRFDDKSTYTYITSWAEMYRRHWGGGWASREEAHPHVPPLCAGGYGAELRAMIRLAQTLGAADGASLLNWIDKFSYDGCRVEDILKSAAQAGYSWDGVVTP